MARFRLIPFGLLVGGALAFASVPSVAGSWEGSDGWEHPDDPDGHDDDGHDGGDHDGDHEGDHDGDGHGGYDHDADGAQHVREKLAAKFDVPERVITRLRNRGLGYGEIDHTLTLADRLPGGITRENVGEILEMRQEQGMGWGQIAKELDTTMGSAKRDFRNPEPPSDEPGVQPVSLSRSGTAAGATARGASSGARGGQRVASAKASSVSRPGRSSVAPGRAGSARGFAGSSASGMGSKSARAMSAGGSGNAHGHGLGAGSSSSAGSRSAGKAKGRTK